MSPHDYLAERQYSWARRHGIKIDDDGYVAHLNDNLFLPLTDEAFLVTLQPNSVDLAIV